TLPAVMKLFDWSTVTLPSAPANWLPKLRRDGLSDLTVADFLYHRSGLPASVNTNKVLLDSTSNALLSAAWKIKKSADRAIQIKRLQKEGKINVRPGLFANERSEEYYIPVGKDVYASDRETALIDSAIYNAPLKERRYLYSCLNFCILKDLVEAASGNRFTRLLDKSVYAPIGAYHTCFRPASQYPKSQIAPTEYDTYIRNQQLQGYVHDEIAAFSGGVQGNAGLFTTALDAAKICQTWLQGGSYGRVKIFDPSTVKLFTATIDSISGRAPGFDLAGRTKSWRSTGASPNTYGHTGFTGTCCWVDPERDLVFIFLCNSIYPERGNTSFSTMKPRETILTTIIESINNGKKNDSTEEEKETDTAQP
ncbi:MAG: serine hydrolase, partial [Paramuribaculum sp.]|nr:serine hydrolase [Paramuribaculum sp.]